ncbi:uncharacterized protein LOC143072453 isoform X2 [Mytilus galloprovincialis]|uniref:uncharacterized protein LOC143072453 isoform X2 n=1 Tax=Mytilus galloprovincialis TaxID=29158 RepID=UPI003F7CCBE4
MNEQNVDEIETPGPPEIKEFTDNILTAPILIFDLETTGLQRTSDIIQIAAFSQNNKFSSYIMPNRAISNGASEIVMIGRSRRPRIHQISVIYHMLLVYCVELWHTGILRNKCLRYLKEIMVL